MAYSYSAIKIAADCMRRYEWQYVLKNKDFTPKDDKQKWGDKVDSDLAERAHGKPLPLTSAKYEYVGKMIDACKAAGADVVSKHKIALDMKLQPTDYWSKDAWLRTELDLALIGERFVHIIDHKTGKRRPDPLQLNIYAAVGFQRWPKAEFITTRFLWLLTGTSDKFEYERAKRKELWQDILPRVARIEIAIKKGDFPPTPSGLCSFCPVKTCEHWKERRPT